MVRELIYRWLKFDLHNQIEANKEWDCIASSAFIDVKGHGVVVWCDEDNDGRYFNVTIRENYSIDDWGDTLDATYEECTSTDSFEELELTVMAMLKRFYKRKR